MLDVRQGQGGVSCVWLAFIIKYRRRGCVSLHTNNLWSLSGVSYPSPLQGSVIRAGVLASVSVVPPLSQVQGLLASKDMRHNGLHGYLAQEKLS